MGRMGESLRRAASSMAEYWSSVWGFSSLCACALYYFTYVSLSSKFAYQNTIAEMLTEADLIATKIGFKLELRPMIVRGLRLSLFGRSV